MLQETARYIFNTQATVWHVLAFIQAIESDLNLAVESTKFSTSTTRTTAHYIDLVGFVLITSATKFSSSRLFFKVAKFLHNLEFGEACKRTVVLKHPILKIMDSWRTAESLRLNTSTMEILVGIRTFMNFCERCTAIGELS